MISFSTFQPGTPGLLFYINIFEYELLFSLTYISYKYEIGCRMNTII